MQVNNPANKPSQPADRSIDMHYKIELWTKMDKMFTLQDKLGYKDIWGGSDKGKRTMGTLAIYMDGKCKVMGNER